MFKWVSTGTMLNFPFLRTPNENIYLPTSYKNIQLLQIVEPYWQYLDSILVRWFRPGAAYLHNFLLKRNGCYSLHKTIVNWCMLHGKTQCGLDVRCGGLGAYYKLKPPLRWGCRAPVMVKVDLYDRGGLYEMCLMMMFFRVGQVRKIPFDLP